jgi:hypothetical protein
VGQSLLIEEVLLKSVGAGRNDRRMTITTDVLDGFLRSAVQLDLPADVRTLIAEEATDWEAARAAAVPQHATPEAAALLLFAGGAAAQRVAAAIAAGRPPKSEPAG